jgi:hypothetical protein
MRVLHIPGLLQIRVNDSRVVPSESNDQPRYTYTISTSLGVLAMITVVAYYFVAVNTPYLSSRR